MRPHGVCVVHVGRRRKHAIAVVAPRQSDEFMVAPSPADDLGDLLKLLARDEALVEPARILVGAMDLRDLF